MLQDFLNPIILEDLLFITSQPHLQWEKLRNKTVLISGANGFIPSYLIYTLLYLNDFLSLNIKIIGISRNRQRAESKFQQILKRNDFSLLIQDICDPVIYKDKIDFIIHAASQASPKYYRIDPVGTLQANVLGTNQLLQLAKGKLVESFLFFSSGEVYGQVHELNVPTTENQYGYLDPLDVRSCYAESKRLSETMCVSWFHQFGVPTKIVRPFHTYGPGLDLNDGRVYADFISNIVQSKDIIMKSDGLAKRAFCYIADATAGFFTVLLNGENAKAYNVGNSNAEMSIFELAKTLCGLFSEKKLKVIQDEKNVSADYVKSPISRNCPDTTKLVNLGWKPTFSIEAGFTRTIQSYL